MPKERVQVGPLTGPVPLQPRATPVDTFHRPDVTPLNEGPTELQQLATALGQFAPAVSRAGDIQHAEQTQQKLSEGEQAVLADKRLQNRKALREAVASGQIPASSNPWFMQGMRQQVYRIEGERYDQALRQSYANSDSRNENDISDFIGGFNQKYMEDLGVDASDPEVGRILTPAMERSQSNLLSAHAAERSQAMQVQVEQNTDIEIGIALDKMNELGVSPEFTAKTIHAFTEEQFQNGLDGTRVNQITAQAVARKAMEKLDSKYLDVLDRIPAGKDGKNNLGQISFVKDLRGDTERAIFSALHHRDEVNSKASEEERKAAIRGFQKEGFLAVLKDPRADISQVQMQLADVDPEKAHELTAWAAAEIKRKDDVEDDDSSATLTHDVFSGAGDPDAIVQARKEGRISKATAVHLMENIERSQEFRSTLRSQTISEMHKTLGATIVGSSSGSYDTPVNRQRAMHAQNAFLEGMTNYKRDNPKASESDIIKEGRTLQTEIGLVYSPVSIKEADNTGPETALTPHLVLLAAPESVDWKRKSVFANPAQLESAIQEYNSNQGKSGLLVDLAKHFSTGTESISAADFYKSQLVLSRNGQKPKP